MLSPDYSDMLSALSDAEAEFLGVEFESAWAERVLFEFDGLVVPVLSRKHLLINKKASGRPKDLADAAWIEEEGSV